MQIVAELLQYEPNEAIVDKNNQTAYEMTHTLLIQSKFIRFILAIANESNDSLKIIMLLTIIHQSLPVKAQPQQVFITLFSINLFQRGLLVHQLHFLNAFNSRSWLYDWSKLSL